MNLHIAPDNVFINTFYDNLDALGLSQDNKIIVRTNQKRLLSVKRKIPFARLYSSEFDRLVGDTRQYQKVFIHYFTPLLYRWVARHKFNELNWMVWGGDLYNLPGLDHLCYEPMTLQSYIKKNFSIKRLLYSLKVWATHTPFKGRAYSKVKHVLTWMEQEYEFALQKLPVDAGYKFFFYENQFPYGELDTLRPKSAKRERLSLIIGNSGSPANNHLDVVRFLESHQVRADLFIPVSYGDERYISFLKRNVTYGYGKVEFIDRYMKFEEYLEFLSHADALIMNTIRPQGYGNILMMLYMGRPVYLNSKNMSIGALADAGIEYFTISSLPLTLNIGQVAENKNMVIALFSHERLLRVYKALFSAVSKSD